MKIIDLLIKNANGEIPPINLNGTEYIYKHGDYFNEDTGNYLFASEIIDLSNLNDEVEIIEEERPVPLCFYDRAIKYAKEYIEKIEPMKKLPQVVEHNSIEWFLLEEVRNNRLKINEIIDKVNRK